MASRPETAGIPADVLERELLPLDVSEHVGRNDRHVICLVMNERVRDRAFVLACKTQCNARAFERLYGPRSNMVVWWNRCAPSTPCRARRTSE